MSRHLPLARRSVIDGIAKASPPTESAAAIKNEGHHTYSAPPHQDESPSSVASLQSEPVTSRASTTTEVPFYLLAKRPSIVRMRDLSPEERAKYIDEYYQNYDVMIGLRIAATLGGLITLFTLFLLYKSKCKSYKEADLSPISDDTSTPGSFQVVALGALESNLMNQAPCSSTYQDSYYLSDREEFPRHKRRYHHHRHRNSSSGVAYFPETLLNPSYGDAMDVRSQNATTTTLSTPSTSSNSVTSTNVISAEVNAISAEQRHRNSSASLMKRGISPGPYQQTSVESENPEPSTSSYQGSAGSDWAKEIVISKRHIWVQYRPNTDSSDGAKSEDV